MVIVVAARERGVLCSVPFYLFHCIPMIFLMAEVKWLDASTWPRFDRLDQHY